MPPGLEASIRVSGRYLFAFRASDPKGGSPLGVHPWLTFKGEASLIAEGRLRKAGSPCPHDALAHAF
jgi:hypothetical protein